VTHHHPSYSLHHKLHFDTSLMSVPLLVLEILWQSFSRFSQFRKEKIDLCQDFYYFPFRYCNKGRLNLPNGVFLSFYCLWILYSVEEVWPFYLFCAIAQKVVMWWITYDQIYSININRFETVSLSRQPSNRIKPEE
jgi:hypothetical protein